MDTMQQYWNNLFAQDETEQKKETEEQKETEQQNGRKKWNERKKRNQTKPTNMGTTKKSHEPEGFQQENCVVEAMAAKTSRDNSEGRTLVAVDETVPREVLWQPEHRTFTDIVWGALYILSYIVFLACGTFIAVNSHSRFYRDEETDERLVSDFYHDDVIQCCEDIDKRGDTFTPGSLCDHLGDEYDFGRRGRRLKVGDSRYDGDEGIFDAFLEAPEIIVGLLSITIALAIIWIVLLRFFAKPIVIATEATKIMVFVYMGFVQSEAGTKILCFLIAFCLGVYVYWARKHIFFAAKILAHSTIAFKENPFMFLGLIFVKIFYVANAYLFVLFFSRAFDVAVVRTDQYCSGSDCESGCYFDYPDYLSRMGSYLGISYLWTVILFHKMRLSVIANIVGSWHFHPENKPSVARAVVNTLTTSFGTLSAASLISTIAERINRMIQEPVWKSCLGPAMCITLPLQLILCLFGEFIRTVIVMLTKFAVILHVFTAQPLIGSAKKVYKIMSRHFKGGFVTEVTSKGVLTLGSYVFSVGICLLAWTWFDKAFKTDTLPGGKDASFSVLWILFGLFNLYYPVLGVYIIILLNRFLQSWERSKDSLDNNHQDVWVSPLAAIFVGCLAMMFFTYLAGIFLDTVDVLFLCFAIDKDNCVDMEDDEFQSLVKAMPQYVEVVATEVPPSTGARKGDEESPAPMAYAVSVN